MLIASANPVLDQLRRASLLGADGEVSDGQLLSAFVSHGDEAAFETLVRRHGSMVYGLCRRLIGHQQDAEDAFQATFLVLARKAGSVRPREAVGNWLFGVAYRTARRARAVAARRATRETQIKTMLQPTVAPAEPLDSLCDQQVLDEELNRLPDKYRLPVILCELEGRSRRDVARHLQVPEGTLSSRLATARKLLARGLRRRGVSLSTAALTTLLSDKALAGVPSTLVSSTSKAAAAIAAGHAATTAVSSQVAALTEGVLKSMLMSKLKIATVLLVVGSLFGFGVMKLGCPAFAEHGTASGTGRSAGKDAGTKNALPHHQRPKTDQELIQGKWKSVSWEDNGRKEEGATGFLEFKKDRLIFIRENVASDGKIQTTTFDLTFQLDTAKKPRWIDFHDPKKNATIFGIYHLGMDTLKICFDENDKGEAGRPAAFTSEGAPSANDVLMELKRITSEEWEKRLARATQPATDADKLKGAWKIVRYVHSGVEMKQDPKNPVLRMYFVDGMLHEMYGEIHGGGPSYTFNLDPKQKPAAIDLTNNYDGGTLEGIYRIEGDTLTLCKPFAPKIERPTRLASEQGSNLMLVVLKRDPKAPKLDLDKVKAAQQRRLDRKPVVESLQRIVLAMYQYREDKGSFPARALFDGQEKPLLSWRVALLPYLDEENLYNQFNLNEPWDSEHNKKLLAKMPAVYGDVGQDTVYQVFVGADTAFDGARAAKSEDFRDGVSNSILLAVAAQAVPWTKPADLLYAADKPLPKLGGQFKEGFHIAVGDGLVAFVPAKFNEKALRAAVTIGGGEQETIRELLQPADGKDAKKEDAKNGNKK